MASYESLIANYASIEKMGHAITVSRMFGCDSKEQGVVIAVDCYLSDMSPIEYAKRNKLLNGKPFKQYDAMLAEFHERGGKSRIVSKTPDLASIELEYNGTKQNFSLSWEDALKETFPYYVGREIKEEQVIDMLNKGEKPKLKAKYATPRSRAIMLFARVVSDAIRSMCPEVNFGCYTQEELEDLPGGETTTAAVRSEPAKAPPAPAAVPTMVPATEEKPSPLAGADEVSDAVDPASQISQSFADLLRAKVKEIVQTDAMFAKKLAAKLKESGVDGGIGGLTHAEGVKLQAALERKEITEAINASLGLEFKGVSPT